MKPNNFQEELSEILYHLYESSGNSKYIRSDHVGIPIGPNEAQQRLNDLIRGVIEDCEEHDEQSYGRLITVMGIKTEGGGDE